MRNQMETEETRRQYAEAYAAHYTERDLPAAFRLYKNVVTSHPDSDEAAYSRTQIQNIVNTVVPKQELLDAQMELLPSHFKHDAVG